MHKAGFMFGWLGVNLIGWMIGIYSAVFHLGDIAHQLGSLTALGQAPDAILSILAFLCIPLGLGLGILQASLLGRWKIRAFPWILATAIGWVLPFVAFSRVRAFLLFSDPMGPGFTAYLEALWIVYPAALFCAGACIGLLQTLAMGKSFSKPAGWVLGNALGLLAFGWAVEALLRIPLALQVGDMFSVMENTDSYLIPPNQILPVLWAGLPFLATLLVALPTGLILLKDATRPPEAAGG